MPIYEYRCQQCGHEFEVLQKVSDPAPKKCPKCGNLNLKKMVSNTSFQLKGTGWYVTDFKDKQSKKPEIKETQGTKEAKEKKDKKEKSPNNSETQKAAGAKKTEQQEKIEK
jgi:putative FmdB family regulatory protein